jgi:putative ATP-dependent endonuclease of the OLD family
LSKEQLASNIYAKVESGSKSVTAQYLAEILDRQANKNRRSPEALRTVLPQYLVDAIEHVTNQIKKEQEPKESENA